MLSPALRKYVIVFGAISPALILAFIIALKSCIATNTDSHDMIGGTVSPTAVWIKGTNIRFNPSYIAWTTFVAGIVLTATSLLMLMSDSN